MGEGFECGVGGILGLLSFLQEHQDAVESDLIRLGLRLRDVGAESFTWRDLLVIVRQSPRDSALMAEVHPDTVRWGLSEFLLAELIDISQVLLWAKTKDGANNRNRPKPYPRPGVTDPGVRRVVGASAPMDEIRDRMQAIRDQTNRG